MVDLNQKTFFTYNVMADVSHGPSHRNRQKRQRQEDEMENTNEDKVEDVETPRVEPVNIWIFIAVASCDVHLKYLKTFRVDCYVCCHCDESSIIRRHCSQANFFIRRPNNFFFTNKSFQSIFGFGRLSSSFAANRNWVRHDKDGRACDLQHFNEVCCLQVSSVWHEKFLRETRDKDWRVLRLTCLKWLRVLE